MEDLKSQGDRETKTKLEDKPMLAETEIKGTSLKDLP